MSLDLTLDNASSSTGQAVKETLLLLAFAAFPLAAGAQTTIANGDFETCNLSDWTPSGIAGGFAFIAVEGTCWSFNNTTGIDLPGFCSGFVRPSGPAPVTSRGILTSDSFVALTDVNFIALAENNDVFPTNPPVDIFANVLDAGSGTVLSSTQFFPNIVTLDREAVPPSFPPCIGTAVLAGPGDFSSHTIDVSPFWGQMIRLQFVTRTNQPGEGFFTLIDGVENVVGPAFQCGPFNNKIRISHITGMGMKVNLCVAPSAVPAHLAHGDSVGPC